MGPELSARHMDHALDADEHVRIDIRAEERGCDPGVYGELLHGLDLQFPDVGDAARDGRGGRHGGARKVRACARTLAAFEVAVGGGDGPLSPRYRFVVGRKTHRTARFAPFESGIDKNTIETLGFRGGLDVL